MSGTDKDARRRFTAADILITVVVIALAAGSVLMFLLPDREESTAVPVATTMVVHLSEEPAGISAGDKLFDGDTEIGRVSKIDKSANNVIISVTLEKDDGVYLLGGRPVRVNGGFVLETRLRRADGIVESLNETGAAE